MTTTHSLPVRAPSAFEQLVALGWQINANQYKAVHLAAQYEEEAEWFYDGLKSAALGISRELQIHSTTAREWIRVGHSLRYLPLIDAAFAANEISYAKTRTLTRWADEHNEQQLLDLAHQHSAERLTTAIAKVLDHNSPESDEARDQQHHDNRSFDSYTDGDGMVVIRVVLPPSNAKPILAAVNKLVQRIAKTPANSDSEGNTAEENPIEDAPAEALDQQKVADHPKSATQSDQDAPAEAPTLTPRMRFPTTLKELSRRWQPPQDSDNWYIPAPWQQRADAFMALFLGIDIDLTTEVVIHIRGDGNTFNDGTPITTNAIARQLDDAFIRFLIHDAQGHPIDATNKRRHPTTRQARLVDEQHNHQCVECGSTDNLEYDHNPPYQQTRHTVTTELEPRCPPCHRARHRHDQGPHDLAA